MIFHAENNTHSDEWPRILAGAQNMIKLRDEAEGTAKRPTVSQAQSKYIACIALDKANVSLRINDPQSYTVHASLSTRTAFHHTKWQ